MTNYYVSPEDREPTKLESILIMYSDVVARGFIAFLVSIGLVFLLKSWFDLGFATLLIILFIFSILITPLFSKIRFGSQWMVKYLNWVDKLGRRDNG